MSRLIDEGLVKKYLDENCSKHNYKFCTYKDQIPWDFIWDYTNSPLYKTGGWLANKEEYNAIIIDLLTTPKYLKIFLLRSFESGIKQFFTFDMGDTPKLVEGSAPFGSIERHYHIQIKEYFSGKQCLAALNYTLQNNCQLYFIAFSLLMLFVLLFARIPALYKFMIIYFIVALYINALVCGTFSGVIARYQSRVVWLLPLPVILILTNHFKFNSFLKILLNNTTEYAD